MIEILPGILAKTPEEFKLMIEKIKPFTKLVHIDVSDGVFTQTKLVGPEIISTEPEIEKHIHLMVQYPEETLSLWLAIPNVTNIIFHIEATDKSSEIIDTIHQAGKQATVALNPETSLDIIGPFVDKVDSVQFMAVQPGEYGSEFKAEVLDKIQDFQNKYPEVKITIDGGVSPERIPSMIASGVSVFISGGYVMNSGDPAKAMSELQKATE